MSWTPVRRGPTLLLICVFACGLNTDRDGDGYYAADNLLGLVQYDCDDNDPDFNEGEPYYPDVDEDGYGDASGAACYVCLTAAATPPPSSAEADSTSCLEDVTYVHNDQDCDDDDADLGVGVFYYRDLDGDGYGDPDLGVAVYSCPLGASDSITTGYVDNRLDCDDSDDSSATAGTVYYLDSDGDGYGGDIYFVACDGAVIPDDYTTEGEDCEDTIATINPGEPDCANERDDDCDDREDEDDARTWYYDADGDGYGDPLVAQAQCPPDDGYIDTAGDCDDSDETNYPGEGDCPDIAEP